MKLVKRFCVTIVILSVMLFVGTSPSMAAGAPLSMAISYNKVANTVSVNVQTTAEIVAANYDIVLSGWESAFSINAINCDVAAFSSIGNAETGGISSISSTYYNVTIPAGTSLAVYTLTPTSTPLPAGSYTFTLTVIDAADENADSVPWNGSSVSQTLKTDSAMPSVSGVPDGSKLQYTVTDAPERSILVAARYDGVRMTDAQIAVVSNTASDTLTMNGVGAKYRLFLLNGSTYTPLCPAWSN